MLNRAEVFLLLLFPLKNESKEMQEKMVQQLERVIIELSPAPKSWESLQIQIFSENSTEILCNFQIYA